MSDFKNITVLGDGGWGTTLALHLLQKRVRVTVWGPHPDYLNEMRTTRKNPRYLPGIPLPKKLEFEPNLQTALNDADLIVYAIPTKFTPSIIKNIKETQVSLGQKVIVSVAKGLDPVSLKPISRMIREDLGCRTVAVLSGPTIAREVALKIPSTAVLAAKNKDLASRLQKLFNTDTFRIYTNTDVVGVELGGSVKNVIAIACGVCDGLGFGTNTKAALLTRGLSEMQKLGKIMGARRQTFAGLSGLGDLATTCFSPTSRNRSLGEKLGRGQKLKTILAETHMVAEGIDSVRSILKLSHQLNIDMPITREVSNIIYKNKSPAKAVRDLMGRSLKAE